MSKIETTRKVSLKLTSRINLGRRGATFGNIPQVSAEETKGGWKQKRQNSYGNGISLSPFPYFLPPWELTPH